MAKAFSALASHATIVDLDTTVLDRLIAQTPQRADEIVGETAMDLQAVAQASILSEGTGRIYIRGGITHQASSPGQPPANDSGFLRSSIKAEKLQQMLWWVKVYAEYGVYLEFGTSRMAARPFLLPAVVEEEKRLYARWQRLLA